MKTEKAEKKIVLQNVHSKGNEKGKLANWEERNRLREKKEKERKTKRENKEKERKEDNGPLCKQTIKKRVRGREM